MPYGNLFIKGYWNPSTNRPQLLSGRGQPGTCYIVSTNGTTELDGVEEWIAGDVVLFGLDYWIRLSSSAIEEEPVYDILWGGDALTWGGAPLTWGS